MKSMIRLTTILFAVSVLLFIEGCRNFDKAYQTEYRPDPAIKKEGFPVNNPVFICNLIDERKSSEIIPLEPDANPLILIPLWPYTHSETCPVVRYTYLQDMMNTTKHIIAQDIRASKIFKYVTTQTFEVSGLKEAEYQSQIPPDAYLIQVSILKAVWSRYLTCYGLSYPGTVLWALGLPVSYGSVTISIRAEIYSPNNYEKPLFEKVITKETSCTEWIYDQVNYSPPISEFALAEIFPQVMTELRNTAVAAVEKYCRTKGKN